MTIARRTSTLLPSLAAAAAALALLAGAGPALGGGFSTTTLPVTASGALQARGQ